MAVARPPSENLRLLPFSPLGFSFPPSGSPFLPLGLLHAFTSPDVPMPTTKNASYFRRLARRAVDRSFLPIFAQLHRRQQFIASQFSHAPTEQVPAVSGFHCDCSHEHDEDFGDCFHYRLQRCSLYPDNCPLYNSSNVNLNLAAPPLLFLNNGARVPKTE